MQATQPWVEVPGDKDWDELSSLPIMRSLGSCVGMSDSLAVWRFGLTDGSPMADKLGVYITDTAFKRGSNGFLWVLATRKQGKVKETFRGYALELPRHFRKVIDWQPS